MIRFVSILLVVASTIAGCATPPPVKTAKTTVILLPDEDGNVGAVQVSTATGMQKVDQAYHYAMVDTNKSQPSAMNAMGRESVDGRYDALLKAQPPKPKSFVLQFVLNRNVLTDEAKAQLPAVLQAVRERKPTEITIFGHADAIGSERTNVKLSADRAQAIANLLKKDDPSLDRVDVQSFGDRVPLYPSNGKAEPRNRRVEIQIL